MASSNGDAGMKKIFYGLSTAFILGGIGLVVAQAQTYTVVNELKNTQEENQDVIDSVDVIETRIENIEEDIDDLAVEVKDIKKQMSEDHDEVMEAIRERN